eukprot:10812826-Ditylum_brightwellii.AAC.1
MTWYQASNHTRRDLPDDAVAHSTKKFVTTTDHTTDPFEKYLEGQPDQVKQMLGNLMAAEIDVDYWIQELNSGNVTIATDGSVAAKR